MSRFVGAEREIGSLRTEGAADRTEGAAERAERLVDDSVKRPAAVLLAHGQSRIDELLGSPRVTWPSRFGRGEDRPGVRGGTYRDWPVEDRAGKTSRPSERSSRISTAEAKLCSTN